jgi:hypothetical protein
MSAAAVLRNKHLAFKIKTAFLSIIQHSQPSSSQNQQLTKDEELGIKLCSAFSTIGVTQHEVLAV